MEALIQKIAIQGELGSFSHQAALLFAPEAEIAPCMRAADAFAQLQMGACNAIALPVENSLAGSVAEHYDLLSAATVHIEREAILRIAHMLIGMPGSSESTIRRVYSHPVALAQCRRFFLEHPSIEPVPFYDTAGAVKQIVELRDRHAAAIAGVLAAQIYGGSILLAGIEDDPANYTRFLLIRDGEASCEGGAGEAGSVRKQSIAFELEDRPGALAGMLALLASTGANITQFQSRPIPGRPFQYTFYVDFLPAVQGDRPLERLRSQAVRFHSFGSYPPAQLPPGPARS